MNQMLQSRILINKITVGASRILIHKITVRAWKIKSNQMPKAKTKDTKKKGK